VAEHGALITLEGIEGSGKSTQVGFLRDHFEAQGCEVLCLREPGGTPLGDQIRRLLLEPEGEMVPLAELFLFCSSRRQLVETVIEPALARGALVICDRFTDSSLAYQGYARGLSMDSLRQLNRLATGDRVPDKTFLLDLPVEVGLSRARARRGSGEDDRFEGEAVDFHHRVRAGFLALSRAESSRITVVDATQDAATVSSAIRTYLNDGF